MTTQAQTKALRDYNASLREGAKERYRYVLDRLATGMTKADLAREMGVTPQRVAELAKKAEEALNGG